MKEYPINIFYTWENKTGTGYWTAYLLDFGEAACSAIGDTPEEALQHLRLIYEDVVKYLKEKQDLIPEPTIRIYN